MASIGTGYDLSSTTFSPDGRVFQIEYAAKAVENSGTVLGLKCKDGVILGVEKTIISKMLVSGSLRRCHMVDKHATLTICGLLSDGRVIVDQARDECERYREFYGREIPGDVLADRLAHFVHVYTLHWHVRPFGCAIILGVENNVYMIEPSGVCYRYMACAYGKAKQAARTELEKLNLCKENDKEDEGIAVDEGVKALAKILTRVHDETKDKDYELEMTWIKKDKQGNFIASMVDKKIVQDAHKQAEDELAADEMGDD